MRIFLGIIFALIVATSVRAAVPQPANASQRLQRVEEQLAGKATTGDISSAVTVHEGESNPHPGYLTEAEGDAAYNPLATGTPDGSKFLRDDNTWQAIPGGPGGGVDTANSPNANEFARFTDADTIEGRTAAEAKADLDLEVGTDLQAFDADLSTWAGLTPSAFFQTLINDADAAGILGTLGVTSTVTELNFTDGVTSAIQTQIDTKLALASYTAADVLSKLLTVDGSTSTLDADLLDGTSSASFALLAGPTFTGNPVAPTASANDSDTSLATTAFVQGEIDDGDLLSDNCTLENDATPIPDPCVGDGVDAGAPTVLGANVDCAVNASYCTIFTIAGAGISASRGLGIDGLLLVDTNSTTVAGQFRVRSADTGYTGVCHWQLLESTTATTIQASDWIAIGSNPGDTAGTTWASVDPTPAYFSCALLSDASPGDIIVEWQLETGTATQTVLRGSNYVLTQ
jgi:hypothetical protein